MVAESEAMRLAQTALTEARAARHVADMGAQAQGFHEKQCSERYDTINKALENLPKIFEDLKNIRIKQAEALALNKAIAYISVAIGILYTILKITGHSA